MSNAVYTNLNAPEPQVELLLIFASQIQGPQFIVFLLLVYQGEGETRKLWHGVALEDLCSLP